MIIFYNVMFRVVAVDEVLTESPVTLAACRGIHFSSNYYNTLLTLYVSLFLTIFL